MPPAGRPKKPEGTHAHKFGVTLPAIVVEQLEAIMREDGEDNRSAALAKLVSDESIRRTRRRRKH
jgi:metal-responsive CopG/Arc/MetJ family transcriptional regulator